MSKVYKLNMNKFMKYCINVNPSIIKDSGADADELIDWLTYNLMHHNPEYLLHVVEPALQTYLMGLIQQKNGYDINKSVARIMSAFGADMLGYGQFLMSMEEGDLNGK